MPDGAYSGPVGTSWQREVNVLLVPWLPLITCAALALAGCGATTPPKIATHWRPPTPLADDGRTSSGHRPESVRDKIVGLGLAPPDFLRRWHYHSVRVGPSWR